MMPFSPLIIAVFCLMAGGVTPALAAAPEMAGGLAVGSSAASGPAGEFKAEQLSAEAAAVEADAKDNEECVSCHLEQWNSAMGKLYIHQPFLEKKCRYCHIRNFEAFDELAGFAADRKVNWLATRRLNTQDHWFNLPAEAVSNLLLVDVLVAGKGSKRRELTVPPWSEIVEMEDDATPPLIANVRVAKIERGLFLNVTLAWETDELASTEVAYGIKKLNLRTGVSKNLSNSHSVVLAGLKSKKIYKFKVSSADIFGNSAESKVYAFSTKKAARKKPTAAETTSKHQDQLSIEHEFYRTENKLLVRLHANQPVLIALGVPKEVVDETEKTPFVTTGPAPDDHDLNNALQTNNTICEPCHGVYVKGRNHPVNVSVKENLEIPEDFFLLANGNITCMTCHAAHSSNNEYRLVRPSKKELCISCHVTKSDSRLGG